MKEKLNRKRIKLKKKDKKKIKKLEKNKHIKLLMKVNLLLKELKKKAKNGMKWQKIYNIFYKL